MIRGITYPSNDLLLEMLDHQDTSPGWCINCGTEQGPVEPDAVAYTCPDCNRPKVYGAQELLLRGWYT